MIIKNNKKYILWVTSIILFLVLVIGVCALYVLDYYPADLVSIQAFSSDIKVGKAVASEGIITYGESESEVGLVFYPGGKVEYTAYEPLMMELASKDVFCVLIEMPFNLAVFDINAAEGILENYPDIKKWYIGGHSLGGSMAASYLAKHTEEYVGLVLLASYSTSDLSDTKLSVLSLYGSEDKVINREKYGKYKKNLPMDLTEIEINGGCHAYFGMYGKQEGDGVPALSADEQIRLTAGYIEKFIFKGET